MSTPFHAYKTRVRECNEFFLVIRFVPSDEHNEHVGRDFYNLTSKLSDVDLVERKRNAP